MKIGKISRPISFLMVVALIITMLPVAPGSVEAKAENASVLYIKDVPGAATKTVTEDMTVSENGWSWDADTATLTLNGFEGEYIEATGNLNIVLVSDNTVTLPAAPTESSTYGIYTDDGDINITGDGAGEEDTLTVTQTGFTKKDVYVTGIRASNDLVITDCKVAVSFSAADKGNENGYYNRTGLCASGGSTYVCGTASVDIDLTQTNYYITGIVRALYAKTSGTIDINIYDADSSDGTCTSGSHEGLGGLFASGSGAINISVPGGEAIDGPIVIGETAGDITFEGSMLAGVNSSSYMENPKYFSIAPLKKITVAGDESAKCGFIYKDFGGYDYGCFLIKEDGTKVTGGTIKTVANNPLVFMDSDVLDHDGLIVGEGVEIKYFHGLVSGGAGGYVFRIDEETPLPAGLTLSQYNEPSLFRACIAGTLTEEAPAGSFNVIVTDAASNTASITVNYGAVTNPPKKITVDGTEFNTTEDSTGTKWSYEGTTKTLTLNGYDGGIIRSDEELNIVLVGDNTVTLPAAPTESSTYGIYTDDGDINITGDGAGEEDTLTVTQTGFTKKDVYVTGIRASNDLVITDCKVAVSFSAADKGNENGYYNRNGLYASGGSTYVCGTASVDIDLTQTNYYNTGIVRGLYAKTSGTIDINIYDADSSDGTCTSGSHEGLGGLFASGSGAINISVPGGEAIDGPIVIGETAGDITFVGSMFAGVNSSSYMENPKYFSIAPSKKITVAGDESAKCGFIYKDFGGYDYGCFLIKEDGTKVTAGTIKTVANNPLVFMDSDVLDHDGLKVGEGVEIKYFHGLVSGGAGGYVFRIDEATPLPAGLTLSQYNESSLFRACIAGTLTEETPAGSFNIIVTDAASNTAFITVNYGAIQVTNPITGVDISQEECILEQGNEETLTAVITPDNASVTTLSWSSSDTSVAYVNSTGVVTARKAGVATITVTTKQGGLKDTCKVYVKEEKPSATAGEMHIENLETDATYSVSGNTLTANEDGMIAIIDAWRNKTIDIIKTNAEPKCNSDVQQLYIPAKTAVNINTVFALATLQYDETPFDGAPKEPTITIEGLIQDVDYTVSYENNIDAGNARVVITGIGDYYGTFSKTFVITPIKMTGIIANAYSGVYDKMGHTFTLSGVPSGASVTYSETEDGYYSAAKPTMVEVGETVVYFKVSLKNYEDFYGTTKITILPVLIDDKSATLSETDFVYDGNVKLPVLRVEGLTIGTDYTVSYENNVNAGTAKAIATGKGNYCGMLVEEFKIAPASIAGKQVTLSQTSYTEDGTAKTPAVTVEGLTKDVDYTVTYSNNINVGTATVTITGKGNYTGTLTKTFEIKAPASQEQDVQKPGEQTPDTQKPEEQKPQPPAKNSVLTDSKTGISYKVTKSGTSGGTVEFKAPKNKKVKTVTIPSTVRIDGITYKVTSIGKNAFKGCSKLTSVTIGKNVSKIGTKAFYGCKKLKKITIKTTKLKSSTVGKNAFKGTPKSATIKVPKKSLKAYKKFLYKKGVHKKAKIKK